MQFSKDNLQTTESTVRFYAGDLPFSFNSVCSWLSYFLSLFYIVISVICVLSLSRSDLIVSELPNKVSCFSPDQAVVLHKVPWIYLLDVTFRLTLG